MNLESQIEIRGYGTSEGVTKAWDTRGRKTKEIVERAGYEAVIHREDKTGRGVRYSEPNHVTTYAHPDGRRITVSVGPRQDSNWWAHRSESGKVTQGKTHETGKLRKTIGTEMEGQAAGGQTDSSSFIGRKYKTQDIHYGHYLGEYDTPEEAEKAARARPYTRVVSWPEPTKTQQVRDIARRRAVKTNPDVD